MMRLTIQQLAILVALADGCALKAQRDLEGRKVYRLHYLDGHTKEVAATDAQHLLESRLIDSNKKFPTATFFLTVRGVEQLKQISVNISARGLVATASPSANRPAYNV